MKRTILLAAVLAALVPVALLAVSQARINGVITDPEGKPIEGAAVTITTPSLTNFKLTFKSDKGGKYGTILNDATLPYHVKIEKEGFLTFEVDEKIAIGDNFLLQTKLVPVSAAGFSGVDPATSPAIRRLRPNRRPAPAPRAEGPRPTSSRSRPSTAASSRSMPATRPPRRRTFSRPPRRTRIS